MKEIGRSIGQRRCEIADLSAGVRRQSGRQQGATADQLPPAPRLFGEIQDRAARIGPGRQPADSLGVTRRETEGWLALSLRG